MKRIMGLDFGTKRIGIALSDPLGITAQPLLVLERKNIASDLSELESIIKDKDVGKIVLGLPMNMDGSEGRSAEDVRIFADKISEKTGLAVEYYDERLSTAQTEKMLISEADLSREKRKKVRDKLAACLVLQSYLDRCSIK